MITWEGEPAVLTVFEDVSEQLNAQRALKDSKMRLARQSQALTSLTETQAAPHDTFETLLRTILHGAAKTLEVERVSLWQFVDVRSAIECVGLYRSSVGTYQSGERLSRASAPNYFTAIETERVIAANDARHDPRTNEFLTTYLEPLGIGAMLDVPLRAGSDVARRPLLRTRQRAAGVDDRRAELRHVRRQFGGRGRFSTRKAAAAGYTAVARRPSRSRRG